MCVRRLENEALSCITVGQVDGALSLYSLCHTGHLILVHLQPEGVQAINELFPFHRYFSNAPQPLFTGESFQHDWEIAEVCPHTSPTKPVPIHRNEWQGVKVLATTMPNLRHPNIAFIGRALFPY